MRSAKSSATSMSCSIMTIVTSRGMPVEEPADVAPLLDRQARERLVEQQHLRLLGQRHGDLDAPPLAVGRLRERAVGEVIARETDARERCFERVSIRARLPLERDSNGFQRSGDSPSSASVTLRRIVSRGNSVMIW